MFSHNSIAPIYILVLFLLPETKNSDNSSPFCQKVPSNQFQTLFQLHRHQGKNLKGCKIFVKHVSSELQCLDSCLREPKCASFNYKKVWRGDRKKWVHICQINGGRHGSRICGDLKDKTDSFYFDIGTSRIEEVSS